MQGFLIRRVIDPAQAMDSHENRTRLGMLAGWTSTLLSALLAVVKGWLGVVSGSVSMLADATNNLADMGSSVVVALGFQWSRKPRDEKHPFGHGRIEAVATLVLAIALILVGFEVAKSGITRLINPKPIDAPVWLLVTICITVVIKLWMALFARKLARLTRSQVLEADAWNHTFDILCTLLVVVALGCSRLGLTGVDGWTATGVALFILYTGYTYAREAVDILLGKQPDADEIRDIYEAAVSVEDVMGAHEIMVHQYGDVRMVSFHIEVDARLSLVEAHRIAETAEDAVEQLLGWRAIAHVDPVDRTHPFFEEMNQFLHRFIAEDEQLVDVHDLRTDGAAEPYSVSFDLVTDLETDRKQYGAICSRCVEAMKSAFSERLDQVEIGVEASVESAPMVRKNFNLLPQ